MGGDKIYKPVIYNIVVYENQQIYYQIYDILITYSWKVIQITS